MRNSPEHNHREASSLTSLSPYLNERLTWMKFIAFRLYSPLDTLVKAEPLRKDWPGSANLRQSLDTCRRISDCGVKSDVYGDVIQQ